jgi:hypothetical protein
MTTETQAPDPAHACNCPNIGACDGSCAPYIAPAPVKFDLTEARAIVVDAIRRMRAGHVACADLERSAEEFLHATHAAAKSDELWDQTLQERDRYHEVADSLAQAIAKHLGVEIGEHSSANCPWHRALEALEEAAIQAPEGALRKVAQEVLERCDAYLERDDVPTCLEAIRSLEALRDVLAAPPIPAPEFNSSPFAWARWSTAGLGPDIMVGSMRPDGDGWFSVHARFDDMPPLDAPAPQTPVALTEEQAGKLIAEATGWQTPLSAHYQIVRAVERAYGIKE